MGDVDWCLRLVPVLHRGDIMNWRVHIRRSHPAIVLSCALAWGLICSLPALGDCKLTLGPRDIVKVAHYSGAEGDRGGAALSQFMALLKDKYDQWKEDVNKIVPADKFLSLHLDLDETEVKSGKTIDADDASNILMKVPKTLEVLWGLIFIEANGQPTVPEVRSSIYFGELGGKRTKVTVPLQISPNELGLASDSHSLVTYYALALEALRLGCPVHVAAGLLSQAKEKAADLAKELAKEKAADLHRGDFSVIDRIEKEVEGLLANLP
jgi:hypothetical protein